METLILLLHVTQWDVLRHVTTSLQLEMMRDVWKEEEMIEEKNYVCNSSKTKKKKITNLDSFKRMWLGLSAAHHSLGRSSIMLKSLFCEKPSQKRGYQVWYPAPVAAIRGQPGQQSAALGAATLPVIRSHTSLIHSLPPSLTTPNTLALPPSRHCRGQEETEFHPPLYLRACLCFFVHVWQTQHSVTHRWTQSQPTWHVYKLTWAGSRFRVSHSLPCWLKLTQACLTQWQVGTSPDIGSTSMQSPLAKNEYGVFRSHL